MSPQPSLTPAQDQVLALIAAGFSATLAARQAGVHRHTVANWLKTEEFRSALDRARSEKQLLYADQAETMAAQAIANLTNLMIHPDVPAAVRLKATIAMLDQARKLLPAGSTLVIPDRVPASETMSKNVQSEPQPSPSAWPPSPCELPSTPSVHDFQPKPGRNDLCPCGSGIKFKRCCLGKTAQLAAA